MCVLGGVLPACLETTARMSELLLVTWRAPMSLWRLWCPMALCKLSLGKQQVLVKHARTHMHTCARTHTQHTLRTRTCAHRHTALTHSAHAHTHTHTCAHAHTRARAHTHTHGGPLPNKQQVAP